MLDMFPFNVRDYDVFEGNEEGSNVVDERLKETD